MPDARAISSRYQWPGHQLKFERPDGGTDFLSAPLGTGVDLLATAYAQAARIVADAADIAG